MFDLIYFGSHTDVAESHGILKETVPKHQSTSDHSAETVLSVWMFQVF